MKTKILFLKLTLTLSFALLTLICSAQWRQINGLYGGQVNCFGG